MAAQDYKICPAFFAAYIAKVSKKDPNRMTDDRREITEKEFMMLVDWWLDYNTKQDAKDGTGLQFKSSRRDGKTIQLLWQTEKINTK